MENATTNAGLEALMVLAVVMGSSFNPSMPETQEVLTNNALIINAKCASAPAFSRKGHSMREVIAVVQKSIHTDSFRCRACFLATS